MHFLIMVRCVIININNSSRNNNNNHIYIAQKNKVCKVLKKASNRRYNEILGEAGSVVAWAVL